MAPLIHLKRFTRNKTLLLFCAAVLLGLGTASAAPLVGNWEGTMGTGVESFRLAIQLTKGHCFYNQIDDGLYDEPLLRDSTPGNGLTAHTDRGAELILKLDPSGKMLTGIFRQNPNPNAVESLIKTGQNYPVTLTPGKDFLYPRLDAKGHTLTQYTYAPPQAMSDGWPVGDLRQPPYSQSVSLGKLAEGITNILRSTKSMPLDKKYKYPYIHSLVLVQSGTLLMDEYFYGTHPEDLQAVQSMTKSVFSILAGQAITDRKMSLQEKVFDSFPKYDTDPKKKNISVRDLLMMSSGLDCNDWATPSCSWLMVDNSTDWLDFALEHPGVYDAGTTFQYCGCCLNILSALVEMRTGMTIPDYAKAKLFGPLGITNATWWTGPAPSSGLPGGVITPPAFGLKIAARDLAKLGELYRNGGQWWGGKTLLPPRWVKDSTTAWAASGLHHDKNGQPVKDYGYLWWTLDFPYQGGTVRTFYAFGAGMQYLFVVPDLQLVCLLTAGDEQGTPNWGSSVQSFFINYVLPAVTAPEKKGKS